MKIRSGFVSNSSTTSFLLWGMSVEYIDLKDEIKEKITEKHWHDEILDFIEKLEVYYDDYDYNDNIYIGRHYNTLKDDETGREFKDSVENTLKKIIKKELECYFVDVAYYDG